MKDIKEFVVLSESVRFMQNGITVKRGDVINKDHPCYNLILPYPNGYANEIPSLNRFKAVKCEGCKEGEECKGCKPETGKTEVETGAALAVEETPAVEKKTETETVEVKEVPKKKKAPTKGK